MEVQLSRFGRKVKIQFHLSDWSGHEDILDMVEAWEGSQTDLGVTAFGLLAKNQGYLHEKPSRESITEDMREILVTIQQNSRQFAEMQALVIDLLRNATLAPAQQQAYQQRLSDIQQMTVIEGAGNYGGELYENTEDDGFGDWED